MRILKSILLLIVLILSSCASSYKTINPNSLNYRSKSTDKNVTLSYKYELLSKKYKKKELAKGVRLVAIKIENNSGRSLVFGEDVKLVYDDGTFPYIMENTKVFASLKQSAASYLWYLLLTPINLYTNTSQNGFTTQSSSIPIGLVVGPGLAGGNMIAVSSANKKFQKDLLDYNLNNIIIKDGETVSGLIGIRSDDYNAINIKVK